MTMVIWYDIIGFTEEFEDHLLLTDNVRNRNLIRAKLMELGHTVDEVKFVKAL